MKKCVIFCILILMTGFCFRPCVHAESAPLILTMNGKSSYTITLARDASPSERYAAKELQMFLQIISGTTIPVYRDNEEISGPRIVLGKCPLLESIDPSIDFAGLGDEGFVIRTKGPDILIAGGRQRGTMYGAFHFLKLLGCRWYTPEKSYIPGMTTVSLPPLDIMEKPAFVQRMINWLCSSSDETWCVRNFQNSGWRLGESVGGSSNYEGGHSYYLLVEPRKYFENHPEYYSLLSGKRQWEYAELCCTNPEVAKIAAASVMEWIRHSPDGVAYNVGQEDWTGWCRCSDCEEINQREESPSGSNIYLVNAIGEIVEKYYPDKKVGTFAYWYTEKPPKSMRTRDNIAIRLAIIQGCDGHPLEICERNEAVAKNVSDWAKVNDHIYIWDYTNDFSHLLQPFPNWWSCQQDLRFFKRVGIDGVFLQGNSFTEAGAFSEMQAWIQAQMLWNPDQDIFDLIDEYLNGYYGPAAPAIRRFIDLLQDKVRNLENHFTLFSPPTENYLAPAIIRESEKIFEEAARAAQGRPDIQYLIDESRMMLRYVKLTQPIAHHAIGDVFMPVPGACPYPDVDQRELYAFMENCRHHEITALDEWGQMFTRYEHMRVNVGSHTLVPLESERLSISVVPTIGARVFSILDKKTGRNFLMAPNVDDPGYSMRAGYKVNPVTNEVFYHSLEEKAEGKSITLKGYLTNDGHARTHNSFLMTQNILLPDGSPEIRNSITLEALKNIIRPQSVAPQAGFKLGKADDLKVGILRDNGKYELFDLKSGDGDGNRQPREFGERDTRQGSWCILNPRENTGILMQFDPKEVSSCTAFGFAEFDVAGIAMRGNQITFKKGDILKVNFTYKFLDDISSILQK